MRRKEALAELIAKMEAGGNPSQAEWAEVFPDTPNDDDYPRSMMATQANVGWLDAAKALHEAVLPGWWWDVGIYADTEPMHEAYLTRHSEHGEAIDAIQAKAPTPARAWLLAILRALHATEADT